MATVTLGNIKFNWKGVYNSSTAYVVDDVVSLSGSSYVCIQAGTNQNPASASAYWEQMSSAGTNGTDLTTTLTTQGDIVYRDGSGLQRLGAGTSGQFLKTQGASANPVWGDVVSKVLAVTRINNSTRFTPPQSPSSGSGYSNTVSIFGSTAFQVTKTIQNSYLLVNLNISGAGGSGTHHGYGTVSFSTDGSNLESDGKHTVGAGGSQTGALPNQDFYHAKVANNTSAGTINIDVRYGGNGNRWWNIINPNSSDHTEYAVGTSSMMTVYEIAN